MAVRFARFTDEEKRAVERIVERAHRLLESVGVRRTRAELWMDISAVHATCPLRLQEMAEADDFNFNHDIIGIHSHLNRETGELERFFMPRFAQ